MIRRLAHAAAGVLLAGIGWHVLASGDAAGPTVRVEQRDLVLGVEVSGTLQAVESSQLGPPQVPNMWNFKISMMAPEGEEVAAGTPVLGFDTSELVQQLKRYRNEAEEAGKKLEKQQVDLRVQAENDALRLAEAEARLRRAELKAERPPELIASLEYDKAALDLELARRELEALRTEIGATRRAGEAELASLDADHRRARTKVAEIQASIAGMTVPAPRDGIVVYISNWRNEKKKVGESCWMGEKVLEIPSLERMMAVGEVDEAQSGRVRTGQPVALRLDAHPDLEYRGVVSAISNAVRRRSWRNPEKVVQLEIELETTDPERMRPGMRVKGTVEIDRIADALTLPLTAVRATPDGPVAFRTGWGGPRPVPVELGPHNREAVQVLDGLDAGDVVLSTAPRDDEASG